MGQTAEDEAVGQVGKDTEGSPPWFREGQCVTSRVCGSQDWNSTFLVALYVSHYVFVAIERGKPRW